MQSSSRTDAFTRWKSPLFVDDFEGTSVQVPHDGLYGFIFGKEKHNGIFELNVKREMNKNEKKASLQSSVDSDEDTRLVGESSSSSSDYDHSGCTYRASFITRCEQMSETMDLPMVSPSSTQKVQKVIGSTRIAKVIYLPEGTKVEVEKVTGYESGWAWGLVLAKNYSSTSSAVEANSGDGYSAGDCKEIDPPMKKQRSGNENDRSDRDVLHPEKKLSLDPPGIGKKKFMCSECCKKIQNIHALRNHYISVHAPKLGEIGSTEYDDLVGPKLFRTPLKTAYDDDDVVIVVKPQGIPVQGSEKWTLMNGDLLMPFRSKGKRDNDLSKPRITHRLDSATGGLLVVAKSYSAERIIKEYFATKQCQKRYRAIVFGKLVENQHDYCELDEGESDVGKGVGNGVINAALGGKDSITRYKIVSYTPCNHAMANGFITTVDLYPLTGRKHQLRRHLKMIGHPIVGDMRYSPYNTSEKEDIKRLSAECMDDFTAEKNPHGLMCLWALEITFPHPVTKELVTAKIDEPGWYSELRAVYNST